MPLKIIQFRGGTATEHENFIGHNREVTVDTTNIRLRVHDGVTPGGYEIANETDVPVNNGQLENDIYCSGENLTKLSDLTQDVAYLKKADLTKLSELENDSAYIAGHCTFCTHCTHCTHCS